MLWGAQQWERDNWLVMRCKLEADQQRPATHQSLLKWYNQEERMLVGMWSEMLVSVSSPGLAADKLPESSHLQLGTSSSSCVLSSRAARVIVIEVIINQLRTILWAVMRPPPLWWWWSTVSTVLFLIIFVCVRTWKLLSELYEAGSSINLISSYQESYDKIDVDATQDSH